MDDYNLYDQINTTAANWLRIYAKSVQMPLGIRNFNRKNYFYVWVLKMIDMASIANGYQDYYINCSLIDWLIFRFVRKYKHMKKLPRNFNDTKIAFIDVSVFVDEICDACKVKPINIENMFDGYWRY